MNKNQHISDLDSRQAAQRMFDESKDAQRVVIVGEYSNQSAVCPGNHNSSSLASLGIQRIEVPTIIKEVQIVEVEKQVIVKEIQTVLVPTIVKEFVIIEVPVVIEKVKTIEIEKPITVIEYKILEVPVVVKEMASFPTWLKWILIAQTVIMIINVIKK